MATNTTKLNLPRPDASDNFNRAAYNGLIDAIDANVGAKTDAAATHIADGTKHISPADKAKWDGMIPASQKGAASGVASLGADGKVPTAQLPTLASTANDITIADANDYYTSTKVEGALAEIGQTLAGTRTSIVTTAQQLGVM